MNKCLLIMNCQCNEHVFSFMLFSRYFSFCWKMWKLMLWIQRSLCLQVKKHFVGFAVNQSHQRCFLYFSFQKRWRIQHINHLLWIELEVFLVLVQLSISRGVFLMVQDNALPFRGNLFLSLCFGHQLPCDVCVYVFNKCILIVKRLVSEISE